MREYSANIKAARDLWVKHALTLSWVFWSEENASRIIRCYEKDGDVYNFRPTRRGRPKKTNDFVRSPEWRALRQEVLSEFGESCMRCGSTKDIQVDHIKPKSKYPELALSKDNLQVLCWPCNKAKSNKDETDYRPKVN